ncbi:MAG: heparinase II/III family protein [Candidatus Andeanibacterium colombiense]|uniref:Heparinase II/III family protein n=1 Tax=Candidatus Andeanibacterium colombiense TaxID=3121345 RepID=A0AAJ5X864_9SPHN|nr:MAG: heparinase II/III family protein [Sphingomonadaceae bacterium]
MDIGRVFRTTRHLTAEQWLYRFVCRGKFATMEKLPDLALKRFAKAAEAVPMPNPGASALAAVAVHVRQLQEAVHGRFADGISLGRFTFLGRTIDFGGLNLVEWRRDLGERNNPLWRMNLSYMGYLVPLFEKDARTALPIARGLLASMAAQNPWSSPGIFRDVWHPYSVSHRVINLLVCLQLLNEQAPELVSSASVLVDQIRLGAAFILGNLERDLQYNHLLKNYVCLAALASAAPGFAARVLQGTGASIKQQFLSDGGQAERAPMYHILSLLDLRILRDSSAFAGETQALIARTADASEAAVAGMVHPDGEVALFNDSWLGEGPSACDAVPGLTLSPHVPTRWLLPEAGYLRLAAGDDSVIMDFGPCGPDDNPGHAHADFLSLELSLAGKRLLVDTGTPTYTQGAKRDMLRSAASHNGPIREGLEPIEFWGSFRVGHRGYCHVLPVDGAMRFAAWQDGYIGHGTAVARAIELIPGKGILIADAWVGAPVGTAKVNFLIPGDWTMTGTRAIAGAAAIRFEVMVGALSAFEPAQHWLRFGEGRQAWRITLAPTAAEGVQTTLLWIAHDGAEQPVSEGRELREALVNAFLAVPAIGKLI